MRVPYKRIDEKLDKILKEINAQKETQFSNTFFSMGLSFMLLAIAVLITLGVTIFQIIFPFDPTKGVDMIIFLFEMFFILMAIGVILMFSANRFTKWLIKAKTKK